jgi:hypothetical protein
MDVIKYENSNYLNYLYYNIKLHLVFLMSNFLLLLIHHQFILLIPAFTD